MLTIDDKIKRFEKMTRWMTEDLERAMFLAKANFLVAAGIVAYIETIGSFIYPQKNIKSKIVKTTTGERFYEFYKRLGNEYIILNKRFWGRNRKKIYDDLRNGLLHEYMIKRKAFTIYGADRIMNDKEMLGCASCGIVFDLANNKWHIYTPRFYYDFKKAIEVYVAELKIGNDKKLIKDFDIRSGEVNMSNFI